MNADCAFGDHDYGRSRTGWVCLSCGYRNWPYFGYLGAMGKLAKRHGRTLTQELDAQELEADGGITVK